MGDDHVANQIESYGPELLQTYSLVLMHFSSTEKFVFFVLCRLISHPAKEVDWSLIGTLEGASIRVLVGQVSALARYRLTADAHRVIDASCKRILKRFEKRNYLAHGVCRPGKKPGTVEIHSLRRKGDGYPEGHRTYSIDDLKKMISDLQAEIAKIEGALIMSGVAPFSAR